MTFRTTAEDASMVKLRQRTQGGRVIVDILVPFSDAYESKGQMAIQIAEGFGKNYGTNVSASYILQDDATEKDFNDGLSPETRAAVIQRMGEYSRDGIQFKVQVY